MAIIAGGWSALFLGTIFLSADINFTPGAWSPVEPRIAFIAKSGDAAAIFRNGWLFANLDGASRSGRDSEHKNTEKAHRSQIWIGNASDRHCSQIDEIDGIHSAPIWAPDGQSIAFVRVLGAKDDAVTELVRRYGNGTSTILHRENFSERAPTNKLELRGSPGSWAATGRFLAVPWISKSGGKRTLIVNVAAQTVAMDMTGYSLPSWSPNGKRLVMHRSVPATGWALFAVNDRDDFAPAGEIADSSRGVADPTAESSTVEPIQPAVWEDVGAFLISRTQLESRRFRQQRFEGPRIEIVRVSVEDMSTRAIHHAPLAHESLGKAPQCSFTFDPTHEALALAVLQEDVPVQLDWMRIDSPAARPRWHPLDDDISPNQIPLGALAIDSTGRYLAFRFGIPEWSAATGVYDLENNRLATLTPNDSVRQRALWSVAEALKRILLQKPKETSPFRMGNVLDAEMRRDLNESVPNALSLFRWPPAGKSARSRPNVIGRPGGDEEPASADTTRAIERLTAAGLRILASDVPDARERTGDSLDARVVRYRLAESEVFFRYARRDYAGTLAALQQLEDVSRGAVSAEFDVVLGVIRVQALIEMGRLREARLIVPNLLASRERQWDLDRKVARMPQLQLERQRLDDESDEPSIALGEAASGDDYLLERLRLLNDACRLPPSSVENPHQPATSSAVP